MAGSDALWSASAAVVAQVSESEAALRKGALHRTEPQDPKALILNSL